MLLTFMALHFVGSVSQTKKTLDILKRAPISEFSVASRDVCASLQFFPTSQHTTCFVYSAAHVRAKNVCKLIVFTWLVIFHSSYHLSGGWCEKYLFLERTTYKKRFCL